MSNLSPGFLRFCHAIVTFTIAAIVAAIFAGSGPGLLRGIGSAAARQLDGPGANDDRRPHAGQSFTSRPQGLASTAISGYALLPFVAKPRPLAGPAGRQVPVPIVAGLLPEASAIAVDGNLVFIGAGSGLQIVDVTDPSAPRLLGTNLTKARNRLIAHQIVVKGDLAYLLGWEAEASSSITFFETHSAVLVFDVSNKAQPQLILDMGFRETLYSIAVQGTWLYATGWYSEPGGSHDPHFGLVRINAARSDALEHQGFQDLGMWLVDLQPMGDSWIVAGMSFPPDNRAALQSLNFADPASGRSLADLSAVQGMLTSVVLLNGQAYAILDDDPTQVSPGHLLAVDLAPADVAPAPTAIVGLNPAGCVQKSLAASEQTGLLLITCGQGPDTLVTFAPLVTGNAGPRFTTEPLGQVILPGQSDSCGFGFQQKPLAVGDDLAFVLGTRFGWNDTVLSIVDVAAPDSPRILSTLR